MRVLLADDHALFRDGLRSLLEARGVEVIGEARNGREAVDQTRRFSSEIVLMDQGAAAQIVVDGLDQPDIFQSIKAGSGGSGGH